MKPVIVVHGGAGRIFKEREEGSRAGVVRAALRGYGILKRGGSALDAVEEAVRSMEDDPHFNAGSFSRIEFKIIMHFKCFALMLLKMLACIFFELCTLQWSKY